MLYISTGDGMGPDPPDTLNTGQDISDLLSSVLRIDVDHPADGRAYGIPTDNPFVHTTGARPEVWAYGLRNPWRMSVDLKTGDLWVGDVGWELWEMIYRVERGANYGWSIMEGSHQVIKADGKRGPTLILPPTYEHPHSEAASITGGFVYHGSRLRDLQGAYIYGDYQTGKIWALRHDGTRITSHRELVDTPFQVVSFGEDRDGELMIVDFGGTLQRLVPNPATGQQFPRKLSETGLFSAVSQQSLEAGVMPYAINAEQWLDGATAQRFIALPGSSTVITTNVPWMLPKDTVFVRTLSLPLIAGRLLSGSKVETQLLHFDGDNWNAYSYRWNEEQTDAELVKAGGAEQMLLIRDEKAPKGRRQQTWRFASRAECLRCHNSWCGYVLGFSAAQLDRLARFRIETVVIAGEPPSEPRLIKDNPLHELVQAGLFDRTPQTNNASRLYPLQDPIADLGARARSWLHVNCSHCHREHAGGAVLSFMNYDWPLEKLNLVGARPMQGTFGIQDAKVVAAGDPYRSVLYYRISKLGKGHMPYLGSRLIDQRGTGLIHDWIRSLTPAGTNLAPVAVHRERTEQFNDVAKLKRASHAEQADVMIERLLSSVSGALILLRTIEESQIAPAILNQILAKGIAATDRQIADLFERFVPEEQRIKTLGTEIKPEAILSLRGDAGRGQKIFFQPGGAQCNTCHRINGDGRDFGPDLSQIGRKYTRAQILESSLSPSKSIDPKFVPYTIETRDGNVRCGFLLKRDNTEIMLKDASSAEIRIPAADVSNLQAQTLSLMPEGLLQTCTAQEAADLVEFLAELR